jgi:hypothetical protein
MYLGAPLHISRPPVYRIYSRGNLMKTPTGLFSLKGAAIRRALFPAGF